MADQVRVVETRFIPTDKTSGALENIAKEAKAADAELGKTEKAVDAVTEAVQKAKEKAKGGGGGKNKTPAAAAAGATTEAAHGAVGADGDLEKQMRSHEIAHLKQQREQFAVEKEEMLLRRARKRRLVLEDAHEQAAHRLVTASMLLMAGEQNKYVAKLERASGALQMTGYTLVSLGGKAAGIGNIFAKMGGTAAVAAGVFELGLQAYEKVHEAMEDKVKERGKERAKEELLRSVMDLQINRLGDIPLETTGEAARKYNTALDQQIQNAMDAEKDDEKKKKIEEQYKQAQEHSLQGKKREVLAEIEFNDRLKKLAESTGSLSGYMVKTEEAEAQTTREIMALAEKAAGLGEKFGKSGDQVFEASKALAEKMAEADFSKPVKDAARKAQFESHARAVMGRLQPGTGEAEVAAEEEKRMLQLQRQEAAARAVAEFTGAGTEERDAIFEAVKKVDEENKGLDELIMARVQEGEATALMETEARKAAKKLKVYADSYYRPLTEEQRLANVTAELAVARQLEAQLIEKGVAVDTKLREKIMEQAKSAVGEKATHIFDFRNSRFDILQKFEEGFDPDRIATSFTGDLAGLSEHAVQSGFSPLFAVHG